MSTERFARIACVGSALPPASSRTSSSSRSSTPPTSGSSNAPASARGASRGQGETTSTLSVDAASRALASAGWDPSAVDLLIVATCTPDRPLPSTAAFVQARLGMSCAAFDLNAACAGFVYAPLGRLGRRSARARPTACS